MKNSFNLLMLFLLIGFFAKAQTPSLSSDFFDIQIIDRSTEVWDDNGSGADRDISIWQPTPPSGYYSFGHMLHKEKNPSSHEMPITIVVRPRPGYENLLARPIGYEEVWNDAGSGADRDVRIFRIKCPSGYKALGMVASNGARQPNDPNCRCIRETARKNGETHSLLYAASYASEEEMDPESRAKNEKIAFWDDAGSGADDDVSLWKSIIAQANNHTKTVGITPNTFFASNDHHKTPGDSPYALVLKFSGADFTAKTTKSPKRPKLTSNRIPSEVELKANQEREEYTIPFFAVVDPRFNSQLEQFRASPTYKVVRTINYRPIQSLQGDPVNGGEQQYRLRVGLSETDSYEHSAGATFGITTTIEKGGGVSAEVAEAKAKVSVSFSLTLSYSYSWGGATTKSTDETFVTTLKVNPGCYGALFQLVSTYQIYRQDGTEVEQKFDYFDKEYFADQWCPEGATPPTNGNTPIATNTPTTNVSSNADPNRPITFTIDAPKGKTIILEGRLEIRDGELISNALSTGKLKSFPGPITINKASDAMPLDVKLPKSYTKEAWVNMAPNNGQLNNIISGGNISQHAFWIPRINGYHLAAGHNSQWGQVQAPSPFPSGWHHVAVTYDEASKSMKLYQDGKLVASATNIPPHGSSYELVQIGAYDKGNHFVGEIKDVVIWDHARSAEQIFLSFQKNNTISYR